MVNSIMCRISKDLKVEINILKRMVKNRYNVKLSDVKITRLIAQKIKRRMNIIKVGRGFKVT